MDPADEYLGALGVVPAHLLRRNQFFIACIIAFALFLLFLLEAFLLSDFVPDGFPAVVPKPVASTGIAGWQPGKHVLRFDARGTFQISIFEDLHYGEDEDTTWAPEQDAKSTKAMNGILDHESPDLVVLNGDLITGENTMLLNSTEYVDMIVKPLTTRRLPWASSYGNHDRDFNLSAGALYEKEKSYGLSLTARMVPGGDEEVGVTNYFLPVFSSKSRSTSSDELISSGHVPSLILYFLDSRGGKSFQQQHANGNSVNIPSVVSGASIRWLRATSAAIGTRYEKVIPSLLFTHIPPSVMLAYQSAPLASGGGPDPRKQPGINDDVPLDAQSGDTGLLQAIADLSENSGLRATFSGHDHGDDWCFRWTSQLPDTAVVGTGSFHCFGRHSGYGGYGNWTRGSRQVLLTEETLAEEILTWVRLEDGSVSGSVSLNRTYGDDNYPAVTH